MYVARREGNVFTGVCLSVFCPRVGGGGTPAGPGQGTPPPPPRQEMTRTGYGAGGTPLAFSRRRTFLSLSDPRAPGLFFNSSGFSENLDLFPLFQML